MSTWNVEKFRKLGKEQQHKKAAEALREAYQLLHWLDEPEPENLADAYHIQLRKAGQSLKEHNFLPQRRGDRKEAAPFRPIAIYLDNIRSAHNVGSIFRTTEAFRLGQIFLSEMTPTPKNKKVRDAAMGADQWVHWEVAPLSELPRPIIALETCEGATPLHEFTFPESFTLVIGNEEYGCSDHSLKVADHVIEIPLCGIKNSLNVANAFSTVAYRIT